MSKITITTGGATVPYHGDKIIVRGPEISKGWIRKPNLGHCVVKKEIVSPSNFKRIVEHQRENIESTKFIAPNLKSGHFGKVEVNYRTPVVKRSTAKQRLERLRTRFQERLNKIQTKAKTTIR